MFCASKSSLDHPGTKEFGPCLGAPRGEVPGLRVVVARLSRGLRKKILSLVNSDHQTAGKDSVYMCFDMSCINICTTHGLCVHFGSVLAHTIRPTVLQISPIQEQD